METLGTRKTSDRDGLCEEHQEARHRQLPERAGCGAQHLCINYLGVVLTGMGVWQSLCLPWVFPYY